MNFRKDNFKILDSRSIDCLNTSNCLKIFIALIVNKYTNIDMGAFQLNYKWQHIPQEDYFDLNKSYSKACSYIEHMISRYGYSWETIAKYHSLTKKHYSKYLRNMKKLILKKEKYD